MTRSKKIKIFVIKKLMIIYSINNAKITTNYLKAEKLKYLILIYL